MRTLRKLPLTVPILLAVLLSGCTGSDSSNHHNSTGKSKETSPHALKVQEQMLWVVDTLNADEDLTTAVLTERIDSSAFSSESTEQLLTTVNANLRPFSPYSVKSFEGARAGGVAVVRNRLGILMNFEISTNDRGQIQAWVVNPAVAARVPATSYEEVANRLEGMAEDVTLLVQRTDGRATQTVYQQKDDEVGPLGSVVKLYVLGAVAGAVRAGELTWADTLTVSEAKKSLPTGTLQAEPDGTSLTVLRAAELMMQISDNTATDLLIDAVGTTRLADAVEELGHHDPSLLQPFPTTRNMFQLTLAGDSSRTAQWQNGSARERSRLLSELDLLPVTVDPDWPERAPFWPQDADWFASATDVSVAHRTLLSLSHSDPDLAAVLRTSLDGSSDAAVSGNMKFYSQKAGSSPGSVAVTLLATLDDGSILTVFARGVSRHANDAMELQRSEFIDTATDALNLLAR